MGILNDRIKEQRIKSGLTLLEVAEQLGVKEATAQRYESGEIKNIKHDTVVSLAKIFHCAPAYLMGWLDVPMERESTLLPNVKNILPLPKMKKIPIIGSIACGTPILAQENIEDYAEVPENIHADFCLKCKGDSMINARILDGDIVYIHKQSTVENGEIAAVLIDDEATLKRFMYYPQKNMVILKTENPNYEDYVFVKEELNNIHIIGKAVYFTSPVK